MMTPDTFTARIQIVERHERAVVALFGLPSRPVIIPMAGVDFEPDGETHFRATMSTELARVAGLSR